MAKTNYQTMDEYIGTFPKNVQKILGEVRQTIKEVIPEAEETISYQIPAFKLNGSYLIYYAGWKNHISLYPAPRGSETFKKELSKYKGGKGTVQFPLNKPIPYALISKIIKFRLRETEKQKNKR
jgi:uncharacterized protein YdhG (YjbR/CyaY superfamily)